jgi:hypothetical protein
MAQQTSNSRNSSVKRQMVEWIRGFRVVDRMRQHRRCGARPLVTSVNTAGLIVRKPCLAASRSIRVVLQRLQPRPTRSQIDHDVLGLPSGTGSSRPFEGSRLCS